LSAKDLVGSTLGVTDKERKTKMTNPIDSFVSGSDIKTVQSSIKSLTKSKRKVDMDLCQALWFSKVAEIEMRDGEVQKFHEYLGYDSWKDFVEEESGLTVGKARSFASVHQKYCVELKSVFRKSHIIDIDKMISLMPIVDENNLTELIESGRNTSIETLKSFGVHPLSPSKVSYSVEKKHTTIINKAMNQARVEFGKNLTQSELYIAILQEYVEKNANYQRRSA